MIFSKLILNKLFSAINKNRLQRVDKLKYILNSKFNILIKIYGKKKSDNNWE